MIDKAIPETHGLALAGAALSVATLGKLVDRGILTIDEALDAAKVAQLRISPYVQSTKTGFDAATILGEVVRDLNKKRAK
jgi:hypothetical protein